MKTNQLILAAAALVVLASCTKSNVDPVNTAKTEGDEIGFNAVTQKATKAIITGATYAHGNVFQVWGWQSAAGDFSEFAEDAESNFMTNLPISWTGGRDSRDEAWRNADNYYYWPFTGKISFLAIHPSTVAPTSTGWDETNDKPKASISNYTITPGSNEDVDLMFASNAGTRNSVIVNGDGMMGMVFKHALSQIEIKVKTDADYSADVAFDVESVTFHNIDLSGTVAYGNDAISWSANDTQTQNWVYYNTKYSEQYAENDEPVYVSNVAKVYGAAKVNIPQPANFNASILDPGHAKYNAEDAIATTITIGYSMKQTGSAKITGTVNIADPFLSVVDNKWEAGKKYNYIINFRLNEILFNPSVTDWVDVNVSTIDIY